MHVLVAVIFALGFEFLDREQTARFDAASEPAHGDARRGVCRVRAIENETGWAFTGVPKCNLGTRVNTLFPNRGIPWRLMGRRFVFGLAGGEGFGETRST